MTRNRSLDEFLGGERPASTEDEDAGYGEPAGAARGPEPEEGVEPAQSTYAFAPDGVPCAACGAAVQRRWCDEAGLVCMDCKEW